MWISENDLNAVCVDVYFFLIFKNIQIHVDSTLEASPLTGLDMQVTIC